jgi:hypothetical protein
MCCSLPLQCDIFACEQALPKSPKRTIYRPDARVHASSLRAVAVDDAAQVLRRLLDMPRSTSLKSAPSKVL